MPGMPTISYHAKPGYPAWIPKPEAEADFLVGILGYRRLEPSARQPLTSGPAGSRPRRRHLQVHLSLDPEHTSTCGNGPHRSGRCAGPECDAIIIRPRLTEAGVRFKATEFDGTRIVLCKDPAGNRWELRT